MTTQERRKCFCGSKKQLCEVAKQIIFTYTVDNAETPLTSGSNFFSRKKCNVNFRWSTAKFATAMAF